MARRALWKFIGERFPLRVSIPTVAIMVTGLSFLLSGGVNQETPLFLASTFLALLILRITDDLSDLEFDKRVKPDRGLCSGTISERDLTHANWILIFLLLFLNRGRNGESFIVVVLIGYGFFYRMKGKMPFFARTFCVNAMFFFLPFVLSKNAGLCSLRPPFLLGGFLWLSAIAHEYTHSLADEGLGPSTYGLVFSRRSQAVLGSTGFFLAFLFGLSFAILESKGTFLVALTPWSVVISFFCIRLIRNPVPGNARPFFVHGFLFFLVPLLLYPVLPFLTTL